MPHFNDNCDDTGLAVRIALAVDQPKPNGSCPSSMELAAFIDGRLDKKEHASMLAHLDSCETCYRTWLHALDHSDDSISDFGDKINKRKAYSLGGLAAAAIIAGIMIFSNWNAFFAPDQAMLIADAYEQCLPHHEIFLEQNPNKTIPIPHPHTEGIYGLATHAEISPANKAFGAGIITGVHQFEAPGTPLLLPDFVSCEPNAKGLITPWQKTAYAGYFYLGQYCVLLINACGNHPDLLPDKFWRQQSVIATAFKKEFESKGGDDDDARIAARECGRIIPLLDEMNTNTRKDHVCKTINTHARQLIDFLNP